MLSPNINDYCELWDLADLAPIKTSPTNSLYRVSYRGDSAVLKISQDAQIEARTLEYFGGFGAARLYKHDHNALLLEYIDEYDLFNIPEDDALDIFAEAMVRLHHTRGSTPGGIPSMRENFESLFDRARQESSGSLFYAAAVMADELLLDQRQVQVLHGDVHHGNVLHSSFRGWLAIDPKGVIGEPAYDIANIFYNPKEIPADEIISRLESRSSVLSDYLNMDWTKILQYAFVFGCLSTCWSFEDGEDAGRTLEIAASISDLLKRS